MTRWYEWLVTEKTWQLVVKGKSPVVRFITQIMIGWNWCGGGYRGQLKVERKNTQIYQRLKGQVDDDMSRQYHSNMDGE